MYTRTMESMLGQKNQIRLNLSKPRFDQWIESLDLRSVSCNSVPPPCIFCQGFMKYSAIVFTLMYFWKPPFVQLHSISHVDAGIGRRLCCSPIPSSAKRSIIGERRSLFFAVKLFELFFYKSLGNESANRFIEKQKKNKIFISISIFICFNILFVKSGLFPHSKFAQHDPNSDWVFWSLRHIGTVSADRVLRGIQSVINHQVITSLCFIIFVGLSNISYLLRVTVHMGFGIFQQDGSPCVFFAYTLNLIVLFCKWPFATSWFVGLPHWYRVPTGSHHWHRALPMEEKYIKNSIPTVILSQSLSSNLPNSCVGYVGHGYWWLYGIKSLASGFNRFWSFTRQHYELNLLKYETEIKYLLNWYNRTWLCRIPCVLVTLVVAPYGRPQVITVVFLVRAAYIPMAIKNYGLSMCPGVRQVDCCSHG